MSASGADGSVPGFNLASAVETAIRQRHQPAADLVGRLRAEHPGASDDEIARLVVRRYRKELATLAAATGGAAAAPRAGRLGSAVAVGADAAWTMTRLGEMVQAIAFAYGHDEAGLEERRAWVTGVLGAADLGTAGLDRLAAIAGGRGAARLLARVPGARLSSSRRAHLVATGVPMVIGAGVGAVGNAVLVGAVGRVAREFFGDLAAQRAAGGAPVGRTSAADGSVTDESGADDSVIDIDEADVEIIDGEILPDR